MGLTDDPHAILRLRPIHREAHAMRLARGWTVAELAERSGLTTERVRAIEAGDLSRAFTAFSEKMGATFLAAGVNFNAPDIDGGGFYVTVHSPAAEDRAAILAALALMPATSARLASAVQRGAGIAPADFRAALAGRAALSQKMIWQAFRELERAGCYFQPDPGGGWCLIGCDPKGWCK